jgi:capsular polysaccharide biosynthesis protein
MIELSAGRAALLLAVAATLAGLAVGLGAALSEGRPYRAEETLVLVRGSVPLSDASVAQSLAATIRTLGDAQVVTSNVARALGLSEHVVRERTSVSLVSGTAALRIRADGPGPTQAVRLAQQYGAVLTALVRSRFASLSLNAFDSAHGAGRAGRDWAGNLVPAVLVGLLAGVGGGALLQRRSRGATARLSRERKPRGPREPKPGRGAEARPEPQSPRPPPPPAPKPEPQPEPRPSPAPAPWSLPELRRRVDAARGDHPERVGEWEIYLDLLAEHEVDGALPGSFAGLIEDVFGSILY